MLASHRESDLAKSNSEGISNDSKSGSTEAIVVLNDNVTKPDLKLMPNCDRVMDKVVRNKDDFLPNFNKSKSSNKSKAPKSKNLISEQDNHNMLQCYGRKTTIERFPNMHGSRSI